MKVISIRPTNSKPLRKLRNRRGSLIVWCSLLLVVLLGMLGLVVDGGLLMATYRHAQNAADAAALSVANDRLWGYPGVIAKIRATGLVTHPQNNNLPNATVTIHTPPITGPYAGQQRFAEVIVTSPNPTYFIHVLPGVGSTVSVTARAVAGFERVPAGEAILTTNPDARPGVYLPDNAKLSVVGTLHVNSEGGGVDEYGDLANQNDGLAIDLGVAALVRATGVYAVGGVNDPARYEDTEDETSNPLDANAHPAVDPFRFMPTPIVGIGVADVERGEPMASSDDLALNNPDDFSANPNFIENPGQPNQTMVLHPGIYRSIRITGGRVRFQPGIYVLKPTPSHGDTDMLVITGGTVIAQGVMFYNTGSNYQPTSGSPDVFDDEATPPASDNAVYGGITIDAGLGFNGIDTSAYVYDPPVDEAFDGMLVYQRRWNRKPLKLEGNSDSDEVMGTVYAKWADVMLAGEGIYDTQLVVGSLALQAGANVTIQYKGERASRAPRIFLLE